MIEQRLEVARAATPGPWGYNPGKQWHDGEDFVTLVNGQEFVSYGGPSPFTGCVCITGPSSHPQSMADARFIATHDPADANRRYRNDLELLDHYARLDAESEGNLTHDEIFERQAQLELLRDLVADLIDVYPEVTRA